MIETVRIGSIFVFVALGLFFTFVSTVGVLRLPDLYSRAHTASQADTLGAGFALAGVALSLGWTSTTVKTILLLFFIFVTNPTAAHAIARAADEEGVEAWTTDDDRTDAELAAVASVPETAPDGGQKDEAKPDSGRADDAADTGPDPGYGGPSDGATEPDREGGEQE